MPVQYIICISIDGLRASALGAYGNTWHPTPAFDALASESIVYEWMLCERPALEGFLNSVWGEGGDSLAQCLANAGMQTALTTDDRFVAEWGERAGFNEVRQLEFASGGSAATIADTEQGKLFAVAIDQLAGWAAEGNADDAPTSPRLLWLHSRGYYGAWDAPLALRESLLEEDDPSAPAFHTRPLAAGASDHDELLLYRVAYASQTMVLDECIAALDAALADFELAPNTLVVVTAPRGFALGEHGAVGDAATTLFSERIHVPCLLRVPGAAAPPPRRVQLVQPRDLHATLLTVAGADTSAFDLARSVDLLSPEAGAERPFAICTGVDGEAVIRTPAWMLRRPALGSDDAQPAAELYRKPDDRWEANEIASRAPDVATRLLAAMEAALQPGGSLAAPAELDEDLLAHPR